MRRVAHVAEIDVLELDGFSRVAQGMFVVGAELGRGRFHDALETFETQGGPAQLLGIVGQFADSLHDGWQQQNERRECSQRHQAGKAQPGTYANDQQGDHRLVAVHRKLEGLHQEMRGPEQFLDVGDVPQVRSRTLAARIFDQLSRCVVEAAKCAYQGLRGHEVCDCAVVLLDHLADLVDGVHGWLELLLRSPDDQRQHE